LGFDQRENSLKGAKVFLISTVTCSPSDINQPKESVVFCGKDSAMPAIFSIVFRWIDDCIADHCRAAQFAFCSFDT